MYFTSKSMIMKKFFIQCRTTICSHAHARYMNSASYCLDYVKKNDYENFMCTLLLENSKRSCALAVRSFNAHIAKIDDQVSEKHTGIMRFKFWEETIEHCYSGNPARIPQHPVAIELCRVLNRRKLSKRYFTSLISSRRDHFISNAFSSLNDMENYCEKSVSSVYYLILEGGGIKNIHADHAASHLGKAQGITQFLRIIPNAKLLNMMPLPQDILAKNRVSQENILRGTKSEDVKECIYEIASRAYQHLSKSRSILKTVPADALPVFLPVTTIESYLKRLEKVGYNIYDSSLQKRSSTWLLKLWMAHFRNKSLIQ